jgi:hypothetical protein
MDKKLCSRVTAGLVALLLIVGIVSYPQTARASGGSGGGGGGVKVDSIKVSKCFYDAPTGEMLIKAASSDPTARLFAYLPSGVLLGEVQNGGGSRYGGTVMGYQAFDPVMIGIVSTSGGSTTAPTTPFQP